MSLPPAGASTSATAGYPEAVAFSGSPPPDAAPGDLVRVLFIGSDARPGENFRRTRGDSLHLVVINRTTRRGTILGFPRDSWVAIPGHGRTKINASLTYGGPSLTAATVTALTGIPIDYFVVTGFDGFSTLVTELGGLRVNVRRPMNDKASGAVFPTGIQLFNGPATLAFSRDRHDVPGGDFGRSANQGEVLLAALAKLRSETSDDAGLLRWAAVLRRSADLDVPLDKLAPLLALARSVDPAGLTNVIVPGRSVLVGKTSAVAIGSGAAELFADVRTDGVVNGH